MSSDTLNRDYYNIVENLIFQARETYTKSNKSITSTFTLVLKLTYFILTLTYINNLDQLKQSDEKEKVNVMNSIYEIRNVISKMVEEFTSIQNMKLDNLIRMQSDYDDY